MTHLKSHLLASAGQTFTANRNVMRNAIQTTKNLNVQKLRGVGYGEMIRVQAYALTNLGDYDYEKEDHIEYNSRDDLYNRLIW